MDTLTVQDRQTGRVAIIRPPLTAAEHVITAAGWAG